MTLSRRSSSRDTLVMSRQIVITWRCLFRKSLKRAINNKSSASPIRFLIRRLNPAQYGEEKLSCDRVICRKLSHLKVCTCVLIRIFRKSWSAELCYKRGLGAGTYRRIARRQMARSLVRACNNDKRDVHEEPLTSKWSRRAKSEWWNAPRTDSYWRERTHVRQVFPGIHRYCCLTECTRVQNTGNTSTSVSRDEHWLSEYERYSVRIPFKYTFDTRGSRRVLHLCWNPH